MDSESLSETSSLSANSESSSFVSFQVENTRSEV
jgi:hypothetical protein